MDELTARELEVVRKALDHYAKDAPFHGEGGGAWECHHRDMALARDLWYRFSAIPIH